jgi:DNA-binding MarR family transcriptional regulator
VKKSVYTLIMRVAACSACHCLAARRHARVVTRLFEAKLRPKGLRATQFSVLAALALKGPTPVKELAGTLGLERTTLTRIGAVLERHGWVAVAPSDDPRKRPLRLTGAGRRKLETAFPAWKAAQDLVDRRVAGSRSVPEMTRRLQETRARSRG